MTPDEAREIAIRDVAVKVREIADTCERWRVNDHGYVPIAHELREAAAVLEALGGGDSPAQEKQPGSASHCDERARATASGLPVARGASTGPALSDEEKAALLVADEALKECTYSVDGTPLDNAFARKCRKAAATLQALLSREPQAKEAQCVNCGMIGHVVEGYLTYKHDLKAQANVGEKHPYCEHIGNSCICDEYETTPCEGRPKPQANVEEKKAAFLEAAMQFCAGAEDWLACNIEQGRMWDAYRALVESEAK